MKTFNVKNLLQWIEENKDKLKPPVGNLEIYPGGDFIVMAVGGPNSRKDYHYNETPEFFYQIKGNIILKIIENNEFKDIHINEGDIYLLNPRTPHSPQRKADTIGLVIEQKRTENQFDKFQWYCENCQNQLHEAVVHVGDIVKQLPEVFKNFYGSEDIRTCKKCKTLMEEPKKITA
ncbi:MAG: 3-hydroxyanthranilate 3,4-dioxygenase [Bacteroidetes bacterium]|nr:MAG: 3-hydroxyanthranilate 3,4-dioxygenase [Bacteroidota bacterium]TAG90124.1 MAG: 3-hydroxyanthranilate 3,4-dioxygenase [Bacteroidota bacterium]